MKNPREMDPDELRDEALRLLDLIAAEFKSDPMSVQCFDLLVVEQVAKVADEYRDRKRRAESFGLR